MLIVGSNYGSVECRLVGKALISFYGRCIGTRHFRLEFCSRFRFVEHIISLNTVLSQLFGSGLSYRSGQGSPSSSYYRSSCRVLDNTHTRPFVNNLFPNKKYTSGSKQSFRGLSFPFLPQKQTFIMTRRFRLGNDTPFSLMPNVN